MVTSFAQKWMYKLNIDKKESNEKVLTFIQNLFENKLGVIEVKPKITIKEILFGSVKH
jgi:hypothetical protein